VDLSQYVGRKAVYLESHLMCAARVDSVNQSADRVRIGFQCDDDKYCELRIAASSTDGPVEQWLAEPPFGRSWEVSASVREFFRDGDFWQVSWLFGASGIRIFFKPEFIARFLDGDVDWLATFFDDGDENEDIDETHG
jgi:hypothetical protein